MARSGRAWWCGLVSPPYAGDPSVAHQPGDLIAADVMPGAAGGLPQLAGTVDAVVVLPQLRTIGPITASRWARADGVRALAA